MISPQFQSSLGAFPVGFLIIWIQLTFIICVSILTAWKKITYPARSWFKVGLLCSSLSMVELTRSVTFVDLVKVNPVFLILPLVSLLILLVGSLGLIVGTWFLINRMKRSKIDKKLLFRVILATSLASARISFLLIELAIFFSYI